MPRQYPAALREELVNRMLAGEGLLSLVKEHGFTEKTVHRWKP